jgi:hypothetical protein
MSVRGDLKTPSSSLPNADYLRLSCSQRRRADRCSSVSDD